MEKVPPRPSCKAHPNMGTENFLGEYGERFCRCYICKEVLFSYWIDETKRAYYQRMENGEWVR